MTLDCFDGNDIIRIRRHIYTRELHAVKAEINKIKDDANKLKDKLEARKTIERAKGILMEKDHLTDEEAYNRLRKLSMDKRSPMKNIAHAIIMNHL